MSNGCQRAPTSANEVPTSAAECRRAPTSAPGRPKGRPLHKRNPSFRLRRQVARNIARNIAPWCVGTSSEIFALDSERGAKQKKWAPAWDREPEKARSIASVVFTPARGVIHPSFPLRGRWQRQIKSVKQAPSPSLAALYKPSFETRLRRGLMHGKRQLWGDPVNSA